MIDPNDWLDDDAVDTVDKALHWTEITLGVVAVVLVGLAIYFW